MSDTYALAAAFSFQPCCFSNFAAADLSIPVMLTIVLIDAFCAAV